MTLTTTQKMIVNNPYQNQHIPRYLAVCSVGCLRSPTIVKVMYQEWWSKTVNARAAGIETDLALIPVTEKLIEWADYCICVESGHCEIIEREWGFQGPIYNLSLPDSYEYADPTLEKIIADRLANLSQWEY